MKDVILDTLSDSLSLLPFLFVTYLIMEYVEHKAGDKFEKALHKAGRVGPLFGGVIGVVPQCGFSAAASNLYAGRIITLGTLFAVYLSTSDEMLPIFVSERLDVSMIVKILAVKAVIGIIIGFIVDFILRMTGKADLEGDLESLGERKHSCCEGEGILKPAIVHTLQVFFFIMIISFAINLIVDFVGLDRLHSGVLGEPVIGALICALIGLIPNCGASVAITQFYLEGVISLGSMMAGLLTGAGVGLLVLFKVNNHLKENLKIAGLLYAFGVIGGILIELSGFAV